MKNILKILFCASIVDFFFFSSNFFFTRGYNTKLILAVLGLATFLILSSRQKSMRISRQLVAITFLSLGVSLASLISMVYNNTGDDTYLTYFISMFVWLAAAYMTVVTVNGLFGNISVELIAKFIIAVTMFQCTIALLGDMYPPVKNFIQSMVPGIGGIDQVHRMYGLGDTTTLDTGGIRYSIACIFCAHMIVKAGERGMKGIPWYMFSLIYITIVGNMIARTTTVGSVLALIYILYFLITGPAVSSSKARIFGWFISSLTVMIVVTAWLYNTNETIQQNLRFGFEGFFSLVETGEWNVASNNTLKSMYVLPDNLKTWIIGDGYFNNPANDPNYLGKITGGYYMNTDIGYIRFLFYFGLIGLSFFSLMIIYVGKVCLDRFPDCSLLIVLLVLTHFIIWLKVSTDCFFILGLFLAMSYVQDNDKVSGDSIVSQ